MIIFLVASLGIFFWMRILFLFKLSLILNLGFVPFSFDPASPTLRCQVTGLLILTSVNFRWVMTQRLPSVSYLTTFDKYGIGCLLFLVSFCFSSFDHIHSKYSWKFSKILRRSWRKLAKIGIIYRKVKTNNYFLL